MKNLMLAALAVALSAGMSAGQTVRIGTEGAYPPYNFINDKGEIDGYEKDLGDEICARAELECTWVKNDWDTMIPNLLSGNYDAFMAGMSINEERRKSIQFSEPYLPPALSAYAALSEDADLEGGVIAAQTGTIQASHVAETGDVIEFATGEETIAAVRNGEADAVFADRDFLAPFVTESGGELVFVGDTIALDEGIGMGLRPSDTELKAKVDAVIEAMKADGSLNELIRKWFGEEALIF
ncbi:transporter substrate-binding domain-containing protein [Paracoccus sp. S-4012]|uniref:transporter substrate-binding domain-containing protein n=1 Tax=Paracoccus sp. S-4012 TaxID=2665648 RepID=UPI0012AEF4F8|nr:transporter substrate-binding domain-containing protein [Paracoccus sp. S-4012]MRX49198.1 transporter substrate-binding domain-containing protein [Paracoccus sp. S-4012]